MTDDYFSKGKTHCECVYIMIFLLHIFSYTDYTYYEQKSKVPVVRLFIIENN